MRVGIIVSGREEGLVESFVGAGIRSGFGDDWLRVIGVEWCPDCSTSGRTAAYYEPYQGTPVEGEVEVPWPVLALTALRIDDWSDGDTRARLAECPDGPDGFVGDEYLHHR